MWDCAHRHACEDTVVNVPPGVLCTWRQTEGEVTEFGRHRVKHGGGTGGFLGREGSSELICTFTHLVSNEKD